MSRTYRYILYYVALGLPISTAAWAGPEAKSDEAKGEAGVAAYIGGKPVTMAEVDAQALATNMKLAQSLFDARKAVLDQIVLERLLAADAQAQGITTTALLAKRIAEKSEPVTDEQISAYYEANKARMRGKTLEAMSRSIRQYLVGQQDSDVRRNLLNELKRKSDVRILLDPPRVEVVLAGNEPAMGPADAKVTIVEYVDFQ